MAVQAHLNSGNYLGLPTNMCSLQDLTFNPVLGIDDDTHFFGHQQAQLHLNNNGVYSSSSSDSLLRTAFPLEAQMELQRQELECILQLQNEKLRFALHEQRKQQLLALMSSLESKTLSLIRQKEADLAEARKKGMELQDRLRRVEIESQTWQRVAKANEAMIMDLNNTLQEVRERQVWVGNRAEDAESSCEELGGKVMSPETSMVCRSCKAQNSCVLFLPCRHLCSCKSCEAFLGSCPVCESTKEASMEVFLV